MVHLDDPSGSAPAAPPDKPPISQDRRNELNHGLLFMLAKVRCRGHALSCFLDELDSELIPRRGGKASRAPQGELVVNSSFRYSPKGEFPSETRRVPPMDGLLRGVPLAWVEDSGTGVWTPFGVRGEWVAVIASLRPSQAAPATLTPGIRGALIKAHVLVPQDRERERRRAWEEICREAGARFHRYGYAIIRDLIHPAYLGAMRRYYRGLVAEGQLPKGDEQVADRYRLQSEPAAMFLHPQLTDLVSQIAGEPVKPSYLYFASYPPGSALPRHVDRLQCEFSISLLTDYSPDPDGPSPWPLFLEHPRLPGGVVAADLGIGDAVFYRGRELVHYRDPLPEGHHSTSLFFHYLRKDFVGDTF